MNSPYNISTVGYINMSLYPPFTATHNKHCVNVPVGGTTMPFIQNTQMKKKSPWFLNVLFQYVIGFEIQHQLVQIITLCKKTNKTRYIWKHRHNRQQWVFVTHQSNSQIIVVKLTSLHHQCHTEWMSMMYQLLWDNVADIYESYLNMTSCSWNCRVQQHLFLRNWLWMNLGWLWWIFLFFLYIYIFSHI